MKNKILLIFAIIALVFGAKSQNINYNSADEVFERYQGLMQTQQFEEAKELLKSNKPLFDSEENGEEVYNLYLGITAMVSFMNTQVVDSLIVDLPYIDYFMSAVMENPQEINSADMWKYLYSASEIYKVLKSSKIDSIYQFAEEYHKSFPPDDYSIFHSIINNLIIYKKNNGQFKEALDIVSKDYEFQKEKGDTTIWMPKNLNTAGSLFLHHLDDAEMAKECLDQSYDLYQNYPNDIHNNRDYYNLLLDLSSIYFDKGNREKAHDYAMQLLNILEEDGITQGDFYLVALLLLTNATDNYKDCVKYAELAYNKASSYLPEGDDLRKQTIQKLKWAYAAANTPKIQQIDLSQSLKESTDSIDDTLLLLEAETDYVNADYQSAKQKFLQLMDYYETHEDDFNDNAYCRSVIRMIEICQTEGNAPLGDQILWRAANFYEISGRVSKNGRHTLGAAGLLHFSIADYNNARLYLEESLKSFNSIGDTESVEYAMLLNNLALVYFELREKTKARICIDEAKYIIDELAKRNDKQSLPMQLTILGNLGVFYSRLNNKSEAIKIYKEILSYCDQGALYNEPKTYALFNLASSLASSEQFDEAKEYLRQLMDLPSDNFIKMAALEDGIWIKIFTNDESALEEFMLYNSLIKNDIASIFGTFTETERENYWDSKSNEISRLTNILADKYPTSVAVTYAYDNALFCKGLLLKSTKLLNEIMKSESDVMIQQKYEQMKMLEAKISAKSSPRDSIPFYYQDATQLKKQILLSIPNFNSRLQSSFSTVTDVQGMMDENDIAIEFVIVPRLIKYGQSEEYYSALILRKNDNTPKIVTLCMADSLKSLMNVENPSDTTFINGIYGLNDEQLYDLIWKKLEPELKDDANIYYSPSGYINSINLGAIAHNGTRMDNRYNLYQVSTTAEIENLKKGAANISSATIYGDIDYGATMTEMAYNASTYSSRGLSPDNHIRGDLATRAWGPLTYTREEAQTVNDLFLSNHKETKLLMGTIANEESFKAMNGCAPDVIHIATHGFYFEDKKNTPTDFFKSITTLTKKSSSMLYSGLLFAGANNAWINDTISLEIEDGILTAQEIGQMDLSNTDIVVLSACQTARGDIDNTNGVFGLQRGFKQAGAKTIVMSLWEVPDAETCELMTEFYRILLSGVEKHEAFRQAQKKLRARKPEPYYWAAFVLLD